MGGVFRKVTVTTPGALKKIFFFSKSTVLIIGFVFRYSATNKHLLVITFVSELALKSIVVYVILAPQFY
jgi:hypothetical protein